MSQKIEDLISTETRLGAHNYQPLDVIIARGEGVHVWDVDGHRYLDCLSAYSAVNQGHCHPKILAAMVDQAKKLTLTSRAFRNDQLAPFYEDMAALTGAHKILPMNSGAEAVETAIKAVRKWGYEVKGVPENAAEIIVCAGNFHGRTLGIVGFSTDPSARGGFGPFAPGFRIIPFGDAVALEAAMTPNTVAFLAEPIQGEAGVIIPPPGYMARARELCTAHDVVLILDEIQTGLGRTGRMLAEEHEGIEADVTLIGKALSGGFYPVSAVLSNSEVLGVLKPGQHRQHVRWQPARLRGRTRRRQGSGRGRHDRERRSAGQLLQERARGNPQQRRPRGSGPRSHAGDPVASGGRRREQALQSAEGARHFGQGYPRRHDPYRTAPDHHARSGRLGGRTVRGRSDGSLD